MHVPGCIAIECNDETLWKGTTTNYSINVKIFLPFIRGP
jgi:hypothetical protein